MTDINLLPEEILEQIFLHTPRELKEIRSTCKLFYQVISGSLPLAKKLKYRWNMSDDEPWNFFSTLEWKFCNIQILRNGSDVQSMTHFIEAHEKTLTSLSFSCCRFTISELHDFLNNVSETLQELGLSGSVVEKDDANLEIILPRLDKLTLDKGSIEFLKSNLKVENLKKFHFDEKFVMELDDSWLLNNYLRSQHQLEELELSRSIFSIFLMSSKIPFSFQLRKVTLHLYKLKKNLVRYPTRRITSAYIPVFLESLKSSLRHLVLKDGAIKDVDIILSMQLIKLELHSCYILLLRRH